MIDPLIQWLFDINQRLVHRLVTAWHRPEDAIHVRVFGPPERSDTQTYLRICVTAWDLPRATVDVRTLNGLPLGRN